MVNLRHEGDRVRLRIVEDNAPGPEARAVDPGLEDLFLYYFGEDVQESVGTRRERGVRK